MIEELRVKNLGLITEAKLELQEGFSVITGETGAGKTMLLNSLQLLLGTRADPNLVQNGKESALIEGSFAPPETPEVMQIIHSAGAYLDEGTLEVARSVGKQRKSKAYLGGRTVPAAILAEIGTHIISIHGQSDQIRLRSKSSQRESLDGFADPDFTVRARYADAYREHEEIRKKREEFLDKYENHVTERNEILARYELLEALQPRENEVAEINAEISRLNNIEDIQNALEEAKNYLNGEYNETSAAIAIGAANRAINQASRYDASLEQTSTRLQEVEYLCAEIGGEIGSYLSKIDRDPWRLEQLNERLSQLRGAATRCGCEYAELSAYYAQIRETVTREHSEELSPEKYDAQLQIAREKWDVETQKLRERRHHAARELQESVNVELARLGMGKAGFQVQIEAKTPDASGGDRISFALQSHPKGPTIPISQGASGGELSRIMLAIEIALAQKLPTTSSAHTFVFDEVDAGIGGQAANEVGSRLAELAHSAQVIVVTHLPQVAAHAKAHYVVAKSVDGADTTITHVTAEQRRAELARMLSGDMQSDTALRHADELLANAGHRN